MNPTLLEKVGHRLLKFGGSGKAVLRFATTLPLEERGPYLIEALEHFKRWVSVGISWKRPPVDVRCFVESGEFLNQKDALYPGNLNELVAMSTGVYVEAVLVGAIGPGKALDVDTPIATPTGWTRMGDLLPGDKVFDENGSPCTVTHAHTVMYNRPCYEVRFSDNSTLVADEDHQWYTETRNDRGKHRKGKVRTTKEILDTLSHTDKWNVFVNHSVPTTEPLSLPDKMLTLDPYVLGAWLGGGSAADARFTCNDPEIVEQLRKSVPVKLVSPMHYSIEQLWTVLSMKGLLNNKHIPNQYLRASTEQRLALLQGLMDTDGHISPKDGVCEITQKREALAHQIYELVVSLGIKATLRSKTARCNGKDCGLVYRVNFTAHADMPVFRLTRKLAHQRPAGAQAIRQHSRYITAVTPAASRPVRCISVDSESHLYLAGKSMIPTHNSTVAQYAQAYQLYILSCINEPQRLFRLTLSSEIMIVFQSVTATVSKLVDYDRFKALIDSAPYFQNVYPYDKGITSQLNFPDRIIVKHLSGSPLAAIGQNIVGGIIDEVNFFSRVEQSKQAADGGLFDQILEVYNSIVRRRKSRFLVKGRLFGLLCLVSSKRYPGEFTDQKIDEARSQIARNGSTDIYIYDKRLWDVKPADTYGAERFRVFSGDSTTKPRIMADDDVVSEEQSRLVVEVPLEFRTEFERDILSAIRDIAGMATMALHPFILDADAVNEAFGKRKSVLSRDDCDFVHTTVELFPGRFTKPQEPRFAHIDLALTGDSAGVAIGYVDKFIEMQRGGWSETLPVIAYDAILEVKPPKQGEISFEKIRRLLYRLRELGLNLKWISFDSYQSRDSIQILGGQGFKAGLQSMDTDTLAYDLFKTALYDRRIEAPECKRAQREIIRLERDPKTGRVDHPSDSSKDLSDSMAGVAYGLTMRREVWLRHNVPTVKVPSYLLKKQAKVEVKEAAFTAA